MAASQHAAGRLAGARRPSFVLAALASASLAQAAFALQSQPAGAHVPARGPVMIHARSMQLAGNPLAQYPWFEYVSAFFTGANVSIGIDPSLVPSLVGSTVDVWVVEHRTAGGWDANPVLVDARGAPQAITIVAGGTSANVTVLSSTLSGDAGLGLGVGYDVVVDVDRDGLLGASDLIDGYGDEAGFYECKPTGVPGPLAVTEVLYNGGTWLGEDIYYPTNVATMGELPLVVVSHGNGHNYTWYDHIGNHLASWGYVVMSHTNNTMPGIETASTTTLDNTNHFLGNLATIAGGVLNGHVDRHQIVWIGHSRGGEGIARAYDRLFDGTYVPTQYTIDDIKLLSSIAPTDFLGVASANPHGVPYHLWVGGADADVDGCPLSDIACSFPLLKRATGYQQSIEIHGAGHGAFHDGGGSTVSCACVCVLSRADVHTIMKAYLLPLVKRYLEGNVPAKDFLWRQFERFQSPGVANHACVVVDMQYRDAPAVGNRVIDDFQAIPATGTSSSGGAVTFDVSAFNEGRLDDANTAYTFGAAEPFNGMTEDTAADGSKGIVFQWAADRFVDFEIVPALQDESDAAFLSFRACQCTRAPETTAVLGDLDFTVVLRDVNNVESSIQIAAYGGGIEEPYQRGSCGTGTGWNNEWETIRIRVSDFVRDGSGLDLKHLAGVAFRFGPSHGAASGRIGMDDIEFTRD